MVSSSLNLRLLENFASAFSNTMAETKSSPFKLTAQEAAVTLSESIRAKTVLITGTSPNSLGAETARALASAQPKLLILATKDVSKNEQTASAIHKSFPKASLQLVKLDLSSLTAVQDSVKQLVTDKTVPQIDVLINNAGIMVPPLTLTSDGIESQFAVNHVGPFLLTTELLRSGKLAKDAMIVNVSSDAYMMADSRPIFEDHNWKKTEYNKWAAYGASKAANVLFSGALNRKYPGITSRAVQPGAILTNIGRDMTQEDWQMMEAMGLEPTTLEIGASTTVIAAFQSPEAGEAVFWKEGRAEETAEAAKDWVTGVDNEEYLWKLSEALIEVALKKGQA